MAPTVLVPPFTRSTFSRNQKSSILIRTTSPMAFFLFVVLVSILSPSSVEACSVCGEGFAVGNTEAIFEFPGQPAVNCGLLEEAGTLGLIPENECAFLPPLISVCECGEIIVSDAPTTISPTIPPTTPPTIPPTIPPTMSPTKTPTETPTISPTKSPTIPPTLSPTLSPTLPPTSNPTKIPSFQPTYVPSYHPTSNPTSSPSARPTKQPTGQPVVLTTFIPTKDPALRLTAFPTVFPTLFPSFIPTTSPTLKESLQPSVLTTKEPSHAPSILSSASPSLIPTGEATPEPSTTPTESPSIMTSSEPTEMTSLDPTLEPSLLISASPSELPTATPSTTPSNTMVPTSSPSFSPSELPSALPSILPSGSPSALPTHEPSLAPSDMPSLTPQEYVVELLMEFYGVERKLASVDIFQYNSVTEDHITKEFQSVGTEFQLENLSIETLLTSQEVVVPIGDASEKSQRALQDQGPVLRIISDTKIEFQSLSNNLNIPLMVGGSFNEEAERQVYLDQLEARASLNAKSLKVEVDGVKVPNQAINPKAPESTGVSIIPIIGGIAGGIAIVIGGFLILRRRRQPKEDITFATTKEGRPGERINTDILVEPQDEISTLGDPMYAAGGMIIPGLEKDETVANSIISGDYEYSKNYRGNAVVPGRERTDTLQNSIDESQKELSADLSSFGQLGKIEDSIFLDDTSFEQQFAEMEDRFEVVAPAGKLGMVIDTPSGGMPVVHAIKETSILADSVMVGDRLISVDDEDTTGFTAMQVSKLISQKAHQPTRTLMFSRTRARSSNRP